MLASRDFPPVGVRGSKLNTVHDAFGVDRYRRGPALDAVERGDPVTGIVNQREVEVVLVCAPRPARYASPRR